MNRPERHSRGRRAASAFVAFAALALCAAACTKKTPEAAPTVTDSSQNTDKARTPAAPAAGPDAGGTTLRALGQDTAALLAEHDALAARAFAGKSWEEAMALLAAPYYLAPLEPKLRQAVTGSGSGAAAAHILLAALDPKAPLLRRLNAYKDHAKAAGPIACAARLHAYAQVSRALSAASRAGGGKELQRGMTRVFSVLSGIALPPQGAARILCLQGHLAGCDERGPTVAGQAYIRSLRAQVDALLLHGTRGCAAGNTLGKLIEAHVAKEELLAGLPIKDDRADFVQLGLKPFPMLDF